MSKYVHEIMNREVLSFGFDEGASDALGFLVALGVSGAAVVDKTGKLAGVVSWRDLVEAPEGARVQEQMTSPAITVAYGDTVAHAADLLSEKGIHRLFVVDPEGALVGALSTIDVLRSMTGHALRHPAAFPHLDTASGVSWTDDEPFEFSAAGAAPDGPGVLVLVEAVPGERDTVSLVEAPANVRARVDELLSAAASERPDLQRLLQHPSRLRFRAASIADARTRDAVARAIRAGAERELRSQVLRLQGHDPG